MNPQLDMDEVTVCNICGATGFNICIAKCCRCKDGAEHTYCMGIVLDVVPSDWICEVCTVMQESTASRKDSLHHDPHLNQACKKQVFSRLGKDAKSLQGSCVPKSSLENEADGLVSIVMEPSAKLNDKEEPNRLEDHSAYSKEFSCQSDMGGKTSSTIADSAKESSGLEILSSSLGTCTSMLPADYSNPHQQNCGSYQQAGGNTMLTITDYAKIVRRIKQLGEPADIDCLADAKGPSVLDFKEEAHTRLGTEGMVKDFDCTVHYQGSHEIDRGFPVMRDRLTKSDVIGQQVQRMDESNIPSNIEERQLEEGGVHAKEHMNKQTTEYYGKMMEMQENVNSLNCSTQPTGAKIQERTGRQDVGLPCSPSCGMETPARDNLSEPICANRIHLSPASLKEENRKYLDCCKCSGANACPHSSNAQGMLEHHKSDMVTRKSQRIGALLKRISERDNSFPKPFSANLGKGGVLKHEGALVITDEKKRGVQENKGDNKDGPNSQYLERESLIASSGVSESHKLSSVRAEQTTSISSVISKGHTETAASQKYADGGATPPCKEDRCQDSEVHRQLPLSQQIKPTIKRHSDNNQKDDARISKFDVRKAAPNKNISDTANGESVLEMDTTTALHFKDSQQGTNNFTYSDSSERFSDKTAVATVNVEEMYNQQDKGAKVDPIEKASIAQVTTRQAQGRLLLPDAKVPIDHLSSLSKSERCLSKQILGGSRAAIPLKAGDKRCENDLTVKDPLKLQSDLSGIDLSPKKHASGMQLDENRSMPTVAINKRHLQVVDGSKGVPWKKVRFSVDQEDDTRRARHQGLLPISKDLRKDSIYTRHQLQISQVSDHIKTPSFMSKRSSLTDSNLEAIKLDNHREDSRSRVYDGNLLQETCRTDTCEVGNSTDFLKSKNNDNQWKREETDLQVFRDAGITERRSDLQCRRKSFCDSALSVRHDACNEIGQLGHATKCDEVRAIDKSHDWGRRDSADDDDKQIAWRREHSVNNFDKQREWARKESPSIIHRHKERWKEDSLSLLGKPNGWKEKQKHDLIIKEKNSRWRDSSDLNGEQERPWRLNESHFGAEHSLENRTDARHVNRYCPDFQDFDEKEYWKNNLKNENPLDRKSRMPPNCAYSSQLRELGGIKRDRRGSICISPQKLKIFDRPPALKPLWCAKAHEKQALRSHTQSNCITFQSDRPTRNCFVQERKACPSSQVLWNGCFDITSKTRWSTIYKGIQAYPSTEADPKVCEALLGLPSDLRMEEIKRGEGNGSWPKAFLQCSPSSQNIGVYFCPKDMESDNMWYQPLVQHLNACGLALRSEIGSIQLLIYPSQLLPMAEQRWDGKFFLWGIFKSNKCTKVFVEDPRTPSERERANDLESPGGNGEVIDMDIDMVGSIDFVSDKFKELSPPLPPGFPPPLPPNPPPLPPPPPPFP